jgi:hypothetical protein
VAAEFGATVRESEENKGKLHAVREGMRALLAARDFDYAVTVDQDGDHFANELPNFLRAARHIEETSRTARVLVIGRRISRHLPMGLARGEFEELADRVLLDALAYHAAAAGRPLRLEYSTLFDEYPDFHTGYKLFSRQTAEDVFLPEPVLAGCPERCYYRHAAEAVMCVEAVLSGAVLGAVNRSTLNEQPISTFGLMERSRLVADKILWPCKRLGVPLPFVRQWLANHVPRLLLDTLVPQGRDEVEAVRRLVLEGYGAAPEPGEAARRPLFV